MNSCPKFLRWILEYITLAQLKVKVCQLKLLFHPSYGDYLENYTKIPTSFLLFCQFHLGRRMLSN